MSLSKTILLLSTSSTHNMTGKMLTGVCVKNIIKQKHTFHQNCKVLVETIFKYSNFINTAKGSKVR